MAVRMNWCVVHGRRLHAYLLEKVPSTNVGGDELLPLFTYVHLLSFFYSPPHCAHMLSQVLIQAQIPNMKAELAFCELLIDDASSIEQEVCIRFGFFL